MRKTLFAIVAMLGLGVISPPANAIGCFSGGVAGAIAGHMAGHGAVGAAAGCVIGHHEANKRPNATQNR